MQGYGSTAQEVNPTTINPAHPSAHVIPFPVEKYVKGHYWLRDLVGLHHWGYALDVLDHHFYDGWCYFTNKTFSRRWDVSARTVQRIMAEFSKLEVLESRWVETNTGWQLRRRIVQPADTAVVPPDTSVATGDKNVVPIHKEDVLPRSKNKKREARNDVVALLNAEPNPKPQPPPSLGVNSTEVKSIEIRLVDFVTEHNGKLPRSSFRRRCEIRDRVSEGATDQDFDDALLGIRNDSWARENDYWSDPVRAALKDSRFERYRDAGRQIRGEQERENNRDNPVFALREAEAEVWRRWREGT